MLVQHYAHRLPADYPIGTIRERVTARAPLWDEKPGLAFKAFALGESGRHGAPGNAYASFYLWHDATAATDYFTDEGFANVVGQFGRPRVETMLPLAVRVRDPGDARVLTRQDIALGPNEDLRALRKAEAAKVESRAAEPGVAAALAALDMTAWRLVRLALSRDAIEAPGAIVYEVAHLARPGWAHLSDRS